MDKVFCLINIILFLFIFILFKGVHAIVKNNSKISYIKFNITSGKIEQDSPFPVDATALIGLSPDNMQILCTAEVISNFIFIL